MKITRDIWPNRAAATLLMALAAFALPACKRETDTSKTAEPPHQATQKSGVQARGEVALVRQAAINCRQRIQDAASEHAADAKRIQEANLLSMKEVTQREQLEAKREVVRRFLASNEALKDLLMNEEAAFTQELAKLNVPQARINTELQAFQSSVRDKAVIIRQRETDQRIGNSLLGALGLLDELWGQWNYNKEYDRVQFSPPGALKKYNDFLENIEAASKKRQGLQEQPNVP